MEGTLENLIYLSAEGAKLHIAVESLRQKDGAGTNFKVMCSYS